MAQADIERFLKMWLTDNLDTAFALAGYVGLRVTFVGQAPIEYNASQRTFKATVSVKAFASGGSAPVTMKLTGWFEYEDLHEVGQFIRVTAMEVNGSRRLAWYAQTHGETGLIE